MNTAGATFSGVLLNKRLQIWLDLACFVQKGRGKAVHSRGLGLHLRSSLWWCDLAVIELSLSFMNPSSWGPALHKLGLVGHISNPSTQELQAGRSEVQSHPQLQWVWEQTELHEICLKQTDSSLRFWIFRATRLFFTRLSHQWTMAPSRYLSRPCGLSGFGSQHPWRCHSMERQENGSQSIRDLMAGPEPEDGPNPYS